MSPTNQNTNRLIQGTCFVILKKGTKQVPFIIKQRIGRLEMKESSIKHIFKTLCLLLVFIMIFCLFAGCNKSKEPTLDATAGDKIFSSADINFTDSSGQAVYEIIRPVEGDSSVPSYIFKQFKDKLGITVKSVPDKNDGTDKYEILVGLTNRPESATVKEYLFNSVGGRVNDYIICTVGKKIVIMGMTLESTKAAAEYFTANYMKPEGIKGGLKYIYRSEGEFTEVTVNGTSIKHFTLIRPRYNESYITQIQIDEALSTIEKTTGYRLECLEDNTAESEYEIVIGNANRTNVEKTADRDTYTVKISGKKVCLNGGSPQSRAMAISEFVKILSKGTVADSDSITGSYAETVTAYDGSKLYKTTWSDDFDGSNSHETGIDLSKWDFGLDGKTGHNGRRCVRTQDPSMLYVKDGMLNFYASYDEDYYYGFKIQTQDMMEFKYGVLEMSAILPDSGSTGSFWISLWCCAHKENNPAAFTTEANVVEMFGNSASFSSNLHGWVNPFQQEYYDLYWKNEGYSTHWSLDSSHSNAKKYHCPEGKLNDGLHTFSFIWDETICGFACDGNMFFSVNPKDKAVWEETWNQPLYIILSQATSFSNRETCLEDGAPEWKNSNNFQIDYVHLYQKTDGKHTLTYLK